MKKLILTTLCLVPLANCTPTKHVRGNMVQDYQLAELQPGTDTQSDILKKLGSPTTKAPFDDNVWYYLGQETEKRGILDPSVKEERIIVVSFNQDGILENLDEVDNERLDLPYVREKTPTSGNEVTVLQQFLGNLGRFNAEEAE